MIVVIDTNHLLRLAAAMKRSPLFAAWRDGRFELAISNAILSELESVAQRPKVQRFVPRENLIDGSVIPNGVRNLWHRRLWSWPGQRFLTPFGMTRRLI